MRISVLSSVFLLIAAGTARGQLASYRDLHDFGSTTTNTNGRPGPDGAQAVSAVTLDAAGNKYGTAKLGGEFNGGIVWELTASGNYFDLHDFGGTVTNANGIAGPDGTQPIGGVVFDHAGNMYGTASLGGPVGAGIVWELTASGAYVDLHDFGTTTTDASGNVSQDGVEPSAAVTLDAAGDLYGTTRFGGPNAVGEFGSAGIIWEISSAGHYKDLHDFGGTITTANGKSGPDGAYSQSAILIDKAGDMYGTAEGGGPNPLSTPDTGNSGMVWKLTAMGAYVDLHDFGGLVRNADGIRGTDGTGPIGAISFDAAGNLYGVAANGGPNYLDPGIIWELSASGVYRDLHDFGGTTICSNGQVGRDGEVPRGGVCLDDAGDLFGTTFFGGASNVGPTDDGMMWELTAKGNYIDLHDFGGQITSANGQSGQDGQWSAGGVTLDGAGHAFGALSEGGPNSGGTAGIVWGATIEPSLGSITVSPKTVTGSNTASGVVTLTLPAPPGGVVVSLGSSSDLASVPASVTVAAGSLSALFPVETLPVNKQSTVTLTALTDGTPETTVVTVTPPVVDSVQFTPAVVAGGNSPLGRVTLSGLAPTGGVTVKLASDSLDGRVPSSVIVEAGQDTGLFEVTTKGVSANTVVTVTATLSGITRKGVFTIEPPKLASMVLNQASVTGGTSTTGWVNLSGEAPSGGTTVTLSSSSKDAAVPKSVTVSAGKLSAMFTIKTSSVKAQVEATIKAMLAGRSQSATLTITP